MTLWPWKPFSGRNGEKEVSLTTRLRRRWRFRIPRWLLILIDRLYRFLPITDDEREAAIAATTTNPRREVDDHWIVAAGFLSSLAPMPRLRVYFPPKGNLRLSGPATRFVRAASEGHRLRECFAMERQWSLNDAVQSLLLREDAARYLPEIGRALLGFATAFLRHEAWMSRRNIKLRLPEAAWDAMLQASSPRPAPDLLPPEEARAIIAHALDHRLALGRGSILNPGERLIGWAWPQTTLFPRLDRVAYSRSQIHLLAAHIMTGHEPYRARAALSRWGGWPGEVELPPL